MMRPVTLLTAGLAGLGAFGWTLVSYQPPKPPRPMGYTSTSAAEAPTRWSIGPEMTPSESITRLKGILAEQPDNASGWYDLGWAQHQTGDEPSALSSWTRAAAVQLATAPPKPDSLYFFDLACYRSLAGDREGALEAWTACVDAGWDRPGRAQRTPDLESIRQDPRFVTAFNKIVPRPRGTIRLNAG